jgi:hypothetical protein
MICGTAGTDIRIENVSKKDTNNCSAETLSSSWESIKSAGWALPNRQDLAKPVKRALIPMNGQAN